jgi:hypothetical protein
MTTIPAALTPFPTIIRDVRLLEAVLELRKIRRRHRQAHMRPPAHVTPR